MGGKASGPSTLRGSKAAKQTTMAILEALSGVLSTTEASERLGVSLSRYYQLETRALQGMMSAVEPRPRGRQKTPATEIRALKAEKQELERELRRHQSLLRQASRSVGLKAKPRGAGGKKRRVRKTKRGAVVLQTLRGELSGEGGDEREEQPGRVASPNRGE